MQVMKSAPKPWGRTGPERVLLPPDAAYARWAPYYPPRPHNPLMAAEQAAVLDLIGDVSGRRALDAACGSGRYLRLLIERGAVAVGVDLSCQMLSRARAVHAAVLRGDLSALPVASASMDLVVCGLALGDLADLTGPLREFARVLRPAGQVVTSVVHPRGAAAGWARTFETPEGRWAVETVWHTREAHVLACAATDLNVDTIVEPSIGNDESGPALLVVSARREG